MASSKQSRRVISLALSAACAVFLAGCDTSDDAVQKASADAAMLARSAGEPRATDALVEKVAGGAATASPSDILQNDADKDLSAAIAKLNEALKNPDISLETKSGLQAQLGATQLQLAQYRLGNLQRDILTLDRQAAEIQAMARTANHLLAEAGFLEPYAKAPTQDAANEAQATAAQKQQAAADAQAKVDNLNKQIADKEAQAQKIYADTEVAFDAADALKGQAAIAAADKAVADRKQAEELMAEAGKLAPELATAQADAKLAQIDANAAATLATLASDAYKRAQTAAQEEADDVTGVIALRKAAGNLVGTSADKNSLTFKVAEFTKLAATFDKKVHDAADAADKADASYGLAGSTYISYLAEGKKKADDAALDRNDPYRAVLAEDRSAVLLAWSQSAAQQLAGRIFTTAQASLLISGVTSDVADLKLDTSGAGTLDGTACRTEAGKRFAKAAALASTKNALKSPTLNNLRWIGLALEADANQGAASVGDSAAGSRAANAKSQAVAANPAQSDELGYIK